MDGDNHKEEDASLVFVEKEDKEEREQESSKGMWEYYKSFVRRNHVSLKLLEAGLSRVLFWNPSTTEDQRAESGRHRQREVLYGILSLHRLAMDTALEEEQISEPNNDYGMSVRPDKSHDDSNHRNRNNNRKYWLRSPSPTTIRIAITVVHSLLPSVLELSRSSVLDDSENYRRQGRVRLYVERVKFMLRIVLLASYWRQLKQQHDQKRSVLQEENCVPPVSIGLMQNGGLYRHYQKADNVPTASQEDGLWRRQNYTGRRTGRAVMRRTPPTASSGASSLIRKQTTTTTSSNWNAILVILGELLHAYRPLYWANAEANVSPSYRYWIISIAMDLVSLQCCHLNHSTAMNNATQQELKRRKMRLLLYLLRAPIWNNVTEPASDHAEAALGRIPILGRLVSTYLRDWLWYVKHPYVAEEG